MELIDRIPKSYKELNYKTYVAIINKIPSERPQGLTPGEWSKVVHLTTLGIMLGVSWDVIENEKAAKVMAMIEAISYLEKPPVEERKAPFKVKSINDLTYDEFVTYQDLRLDQWNNLAEILKLSLVEVTDEQIDNMSIHDAMQVFFCLRKSTKKYLIRLKYSTLIRAIVQTTRSASLRLWNKLKPTRKRNLKAVGVG